MAWCAVGGVASDESASMPEVVEEQNSDERGLRGGLRLGEWHCSLPPLGGPSPGGGDEDDDEYMVSSAEYGPSSSCFTSPAIRGPEGRGREIARIETDVPALPMVPMLQTPGGSVAFDEFYSF